MKHIIGAVCKDERINKREATTILEQYVSYEQHERNLFGVVNAITRAGQELDSATWVRFDEIGGSLVGTTDTRWNNIIKRAESLTDKDFEKIFMLSA